MRQVVAYKSLKTMEIKCLTVSPQKWSRSPTGGSRLLEVPTVKLDWENFAAKIAVNCLRG